jgi:metallo-beta-lactamase family protein
VSIFGERIPVRCRVETLSGYSAHADQPALLHWIKLANTNGSLHKVFVVQGEESAAKTLASLVHDDLDIEAIVPKTGETYDL